MTTTVLLETERLVLRPFQPSDLVAVLGYYSLPDIQRYLDWKARDHSEAKSAFAAMRKQTRLTRPGDVVTLAVNRRIDQSTIGHVSLRWTDATAAQGEIRFAIAPAFRRQGFAREALAALLDFAFDTMSLHRVFAVTAGDNAASSLLLRSLGLRLEAHYREHALFMGEWDTELHFAILDREWRRLRGTMSASAANKVA